ncbi:N-acetylglucosamine-6-sulfatase-like isoform X2 [Belonocnema kinseyi]|uniref:N-acetylglucosamine-6-sulfatase-like isoform X2 n=1 Tax=Belonocnema kinseyi TaxID=2817044 RepID=UPI00143D0738|nr:N-acetylglucosamine-6-sulfatase-like isoform X2 [Belonocnema kinseyi]
MENRIVFFLLCCVAYPVMAKNIVLILVDDLDIELDGMYAAVPICCPNRASILTGRYQHNHWVLNNSISGGCNDQKWKDGPEKNTFAIHLNKKMGYRTFYAGKYLNQYGTRAAGGLRKPPGWDYWYGLVGNSKYYNYSLSINGTERKYGNQPQDYLTDVIKQYAVDFIKVQTNNTPFLMVLAPPAAHAPFNPASRHNDKYKGTKAKRTASFNNMEERDKHWLARMGPIPLPDGVLPKLDDIYRRRWETLLAVDDMVANIHQSLKLKNILDNTYIIFTSDNGYHVGQFGMPLDKRQPYETDIHIPLYIRGPGIEQSKIAAPVSSVDMFATILDIAGLEYFSDGTSLLKHNLSIDRTLLIEYKGENSEGRSNSGCPTDSDPNLAQCSKEFACKCQDVTNNTFSCIRRISKNFNNIFCVFEDNESYVEAYDFTQDPYQLKNLGYAMKRGMRHRFRRRLKNLVKCKDDQCVAIGPDRY